jgi:two-component system, chemotaxis family, protein-glutamate methylesterase/glutaminase
VNSPIRILIVDDSALTRRLLRALFAADPAIEIVGEAGDGQAAMDRVAELRPDLVLLDVRMPVMDGVETTRQIMAYYPTPILVLTASLSNYDVDITFQMLGAGALDVMEKPRMDDAAALDAARVALLRKVKLLARVKVVTHLRGRRKKHAASGRQNAEAAPNPTRASDHSACSRFYSALPVVVIGASTGGPKVIQQILSGLPADFPAALLIVQHIAAGFSAGLVEWLAAAAPVPVHLAREGTQLAPGVALVAPDRYDLLVLPDGTLHLSVQPLLLQHPSVDIAMQSVAERFGPATIGVLLTGMGRDGVAGMRAIRRAGGYTIAQDAASCAIYGMPRAAVEAGVVAAIVPPEQIAEALQAAIRNTRMA